MNLKGDLTDYTRIHGDGRLSLEEGSLESQAQFLGVKEIPFQNLRISFAVKEGLLSLKEVDLVGPVFSGRISGEHQTEETSGAEPSSPYRQVNPGLGPARK